MPTRPRAARWVGLLLALAVLATGLAAGSCTEPGATSAPPSADAPTPGDASPAASPAASADSPFPSGEACSIATACPSPTQ